MFHKEAKEYWKNKAFLGQPLGITHESGGFGLIAHTKDKKSYDVTRLGLEVLSGLRHRGAVGSDPRASDGAGIIVQVPDEFLRTECDAQGFELPALGEYACGMVFLPRDKITQQACVDVFASVVPAEGQVLLGWRDVPTDNSVLGFSVKRIEPVIRQVFIARGPDCRDVDAFERKLFVIRMQVHHAIWDKGLRDADQFYICSLSSRTIVYKGLVSPSNIASYFPDLRNENMKSSIAIVHVRFSPNPVWRLVQPFKYICYDGAINSISGNINWMMGRKAMMRSARLGDDLDKLWPLIQDDSSDSAAFDNVLELLIAGGYSLPHALMMMIPEAWDDNPLMDERRRAFYEYHAALIEPWDGPAAVAFTDGRMIGATLDRNGLRPARYVITDDDLCVMSSEVGVLPIPEEKIVKKWRLQPGKMFLIDLEQGRIIDDAELKEQLAAARPYQQWLDATQIRVEKLPPEVGPMTPDPQTLLDQQQAFGYTQEDLRFFLQPMGLTGEDPVGSMGRDTPIAVLSDRPKMLSDYFKQCFAQVANPPIDPIREELVMSLVSLIGPRPNLLEPEGAAGHKRLEVRTPILSNIDLERIRRIENHVDNAFRTYTLDITYPAVDGAEGMDIALAKLFARANRVVHEGYNIVILSDRGVGADRVAIPALLATAGVHHYLIREGLRTSVGIVVETGEARQVHDFCLLAGYGAEAINPYLAFDTLSNLLSELPTESTETDVHKRYIKAVSKGILKVMSKMGISTYQSYCGAQIFDAIGLSKGFVDTFFTGTRTPVEGIGLAEIAAETVRRHRLAYGHTPVLGNALDVGGDIQFRLRGEEHVWTPESVALLQHAVRSGEYSKFKAYTGKVNDHSRKLKNLRGLFELKKAQAPLPLEDVEPISEILKRFSTGAMSFGSISWEAHTTLAIAMNRIGGKSNTGEGGEELSRYTPLPNGDSMCSRIKQVASGRFGVTTQYLVSADDIEIKIAQGASPGEGGFLPVSKISEWIARARNATFGCELLSPPAHLDIFSLQDLALLIHEMKYINPRARVGVKLASAIGVGSVASSAAKAHADFVVISGPEGGTGASSLNSIYHSGAPWEIGLAEAQQVLVLNDLRGRVVLQVDGSLRTGRDVIIGALLGADEFSFSTSALISSGCIMMRKCHMNTCPVGIATQDPELRKRFTGQPEHVVNFMVFIAEEVRELLAELGFQTMNEMIGRADRLETRAAVEHWKARGLDFSPILDFGDVGPGIDLHWYYLQDHGIEAALDQKFIPNVLQALESKTPVRLEAKVTNNDRSVGAMLAGRLTYQYGHDGLPDDSIWIKCIGIAGQSFGAFITRGITLELEGDTNDYVGKGMSGGRIIIYPPKKSSFNPRENIIVGNTALYGAIDGEAYFRGVAGERFAVRNAGVFTVVEGVGDHACEYMTGGCVVVLGNTGRNFAAGMSGGVAYVLDENGTFEQRCNLAMVALEPVADEDEQLEKLYHQDGDLDASSRIEVMRDMSRFDAQRLFSLIDNHRRYTGSLRATEILEGWNDYLGKFVKVMPVNYRRALEQMQARWRPTERRSISVAVGM